jgi:hypothetical protein
MNLRSNEPANRYRPIRRPAPAGTQPTTARHPAVRRTTGRRPASEAISNRSRPTTMFRACHGPMQPRRHGPATVRRTTGRRPPSEAISNPSRRPIPGNRTGTGGSPTVRRTTGRRPASEAISNPSRRTTPCSRTATGRRPTVRRTTGRRPASEAISNPSRGTTLCPDDHVSRVSRPHTTAPPRAGTQPSAGRRAEGLPARRFPIPRDRRPCFSRVTAHATAPRPGTQDSGLGTRDSGLGGGSAASHCS